MNLIFITDLIGQYKESFERIHNEEIYKWAAVQHFRETWDIDRTDFATMLDAALSKTRNLLGSGNYYPGRMVRAFAAREPQTVRSLFKNLFDEQLDLKARMIDFKTGMELLNKGDEDLKTYQDDRAVIVYLCLKYPERYYLYKFDMFKGFSEKSSYEYAPKKGAIENVFQFYELCNLVRNEALKDNDLLLMHQRRLGQNDYADPAFMLLTQDIIYAAVQHLDLSHDPEAIEPKLNIQEVQIDLIPKGFTPSLKGVVINYIDNQREAKYIGSIGERMIMEYETQKLRRAGFNSLLPSHDSLDIGDGLGFDIKSFDLQKRPKYIEVKSTRGSFHTPFYITQSELVKSLQEPEQYYLYRLFEINERAGTAKLTIYNGSLGEFCINPYNYTVTLEQNA